MAGVDPTLVAEAKTMPDKEAVLFLVENGVHASIISPLTGIHSTSVYNYLHFCRDKTENK